MLLLLCGMTLLCRRTSRPLRVAALRPLMTYLGSLMKILVLGVTAGVAFAFATAISALAQTPNSATYENYYDTVASPNCVGNTTCTFTFTAVPTFTTATGGFGTLTVSKVNCRIVASNGNTGISTPLAYAALGETSNAVKVFFLSSSVSASSLVTGTAGNNVTFPYNYSIDQTTQFFVQAGASPTITIETGYRIIAPNASLDQPTCSVSGFIE